jgi:hypothetical protein
VKRVFIAVILIAGAAVLGIFHRGGVAFGRGEEVRDELHQSFPLSANAEVEVGSINGSVQVETADVQTAEISITLVGDDAEALASSVSISHDTDRLVIHGQRKRGGWFRRIWGGSVRQDVRLRLPRSVELELHGVNGRVNVGELTGSVKVSGVNGQVELNGTGDNSEVSGVNGAVTVGIRQLGADGLRVNGINGGVELRVAGDLNADISASGIHGRIRSDIVNLFVDDERGHGRASGKLGTGGSPISISGINGGVRFTALSPASTPNAVKVAV